MIKAILGSAANKSQSAFNYRQCLPFDHPYLSCNDHCDRWLSQEIFFYYHFYLVEIYLNDLELVFFKLLNVQNSFLHSAWEYTFKLMTNFFNEKTFSLHLAASGHRHKIVSSVNKLYMACLYFQENFV